MLQSLNVYMYVTNDDSVYLVCGVKYVTLKSVGS